MSFFLQTANMSCALLHIALAGMLLTGASSLSAQEGVENKKIAELIEELDAEAMRVPKEAQYHLELKKFLLEIRDSLSVDDLPEAEWRVKKVEQWNRPVIKGEFGKKARILVQEEFGVASDKFLAEIVASTGALADEVVAGIQVAESDKDLTAISALIDSLENRIDRNSWAKDRLGERNATRIDSFRRLVDEMAEFFEYRASGDFERALRSLESVSSATVGRQVFTTQDFKKHAKSILPGFDEIFDGDPVDVALLVRRFDEWTKTASAALSGEINEIEQALEQLVAFKKELKAGRHEYALNILKSPATLGNTLGKEHLLKLRAYFIRQLFAEMAEDYSDATMAENESTEAFLFRALKVENDLGDYEAFLDLVQLYRLVGMDSSIPRWLTSDEAGIAAYVRAERFLEANDPMSAIPFLRSVVSEIDGKYTPTKKAMKQLKSALAAVDSIPPVAED